jgi:hypothetical protein
MLVAIANVAKTMPNMIDYAPAKPGQKRKGKKKGGANIFKNNEHMDMLKNMGSAFAKMAGNTMGDL